MGPFSSPGGGQPPGDRRRTALGFPGSIVQDVIVCDDERHIVRLIQVNLERQGYSVRTAFDGKACLEMIASQRPDLLILDRDMPYMSGDEVVSALRADPATADLKVILLDRHATGSSGDPPLPSGPSAVISKPFNPVELMRLLL